MTARRKKATKSKRKARIVEPTPAEIVAEPESTLGFHMVRVSATRNLMVRETARGILYQYINADKLQRESFQAAATDSGVPFSTYAADMSFELADAFERACENHQSPF